MEISAREILIARRTGEADARHAKRCGNVVSLENLSAHAEAVFDNVPKGPQMQLLASAWIDGYLSVVAKLVV